MQSVTAYNRGVYILNIEIFLDKYSNKILRAGAFFYILVEAGTAEYSHNTFGCERRKYKSRKK